MKRLAVVVAAALGGCSSSPCDGQPAVCVAVRAVGSVPPLDRIELAASAGGIVRRSHTVDAPPLHLPLQFAVLLDPGTSGNVELRLEGFSGRTSLAQGNGSVTLPPSGQRVTIRMNAVMAVSGDLAGPVDDLAASADFAGLFDLRPAADLSTVDLSAAPDLASPDLAGAFKRVFVTSAVFNGALGGHSGADTTCSNIATSAGLGGVWMAWIATSVSTPAQRFTHATVPYRLLDGSVVANNWTQLTSGALQHPIDLTELLGPPGRNHLSYPGCPGAQNPNTYVWSNTGIDGGRDLFGATPHPNCVDFSATDNTTSGRLGSSIATGADWTTTCMVSPCSATAPLYCFEQ